MKCGSAISLGLRVRALDRSSSTFLVYRRSQRTRKDEKKAPKIFDPKKTRSRKFLLISFFGQFRATAFMLPPFIQPFRAHCSVELERAQAHWPGSKSGTQSKKRPVPIAVLLGLIHGKALESFRKANETKILLQVRNESGHWKTKFKLKARKTQSSRVFNPEFKLDFFLRPRLNISRLV